MESHDATCDVMFVYYRLNMITSNPSLIKKPPPQEDNELIWLLCKWHSRQHKALIEFPFKMDQIMSQSGKRRQWTWKTSSEVVLFFLIPFQTNNESIDFHQHNKFTWLLLVCSTATLRSLRPKTGLVKKGWLFFLLILTK